MLLFSWCSYSLCASQSPAESETSARVSKRKGTVARRGVKADQVFDLQRPSLEGDSRMTGQVERAFMLARSARFATLREIKNQLRAEGFTYSDLAHLGGPSLQSQLWKVILACQSVLLAQLPETTRNEALPELSPSASSSLSPASDHCNKKYLQKAEAARRQAESENDPVSRKWWLELAKKWNECAAIRREPGAFDEVD